MSYKSCVEELLQSVYNICHESAKAFERCHEIIKTIADSWDQMHSIPIRGGLRSYFDDFRGQNATENGEMTYFIWPQFLLAAASCTTDQQVGDDTLARFIKDAADYGVDVLMNPDGEGVDFAADEDQRRHAGDHGDGHGVGTAEPADDATTKEEAAVKSMQKAGLARLTAVFQDKARWEHLPTVRKTYKRKRGIDRRFSGPLHLRTRDPFDY